MCPFKVVFVGDLPSNPYLRLRTHRDDKPALRLSCVCFPGNVVLARGGNGRRRGDERGEVFRDGDVTVSLPTPRHQPPLS